MRSIYICLQLLIFLNKRASTTDHTGGHHKTKKHSQDNHNSTVNGDKQNVLLISLDGFRWDYFDKVDTPILNSFKKQGAHAKYVKNVNPTSTFPNHVTLATGLYPESHGFVSNEMYDPILHSIFNMTVTDPNWWWNSHVEPIWHTNEKQGGISGVCYWPGFNVDGYRPRFYADEEEKYDIPYHDLKNLMPYKERVDSLIKWLLADKPPNFLMLYFGQLDEKGHEYGFASDESLREVSKLDNTIGYLLDQLSKHELLDRWNIVITGDHGMTNFSLTKVVNISDYVNSSDYTVVGDVGVVFIWPKEGKTEEIFKKLKGAHPRMKAYLKEDIPKDFHIGNNRRVSPIVLILDEGWMLNTAHHPFNREKFYPAGHGFLNIYPSMWPLFLARGPAFKKRYLSHSFESVDIYSLMCKILGIQAQPNNGSLSHVRQLLTEQATTPYFNPILFGVIVASLFFALGIFIFAIAICFSHKKTRRMRSKPWKTKIVMSELEETNDPLLRDEEVEEDVNFRDDSPL